MSKFGGAYENKAKTEQFFSSLSTSNFARDRVYKNIHDKLEFRKIKAIKIKNG